MKKYIAVLVGYTLTVIVCLLLINLIYIKYDKTCQRWIYNDMPEKLDICNFGNSHGLYGYDYEKYNNKYNCFNFAMSAQTISYDYRLLKEYQSHINSNTTVFINISFFSLYGDSEQDKDDFKEKNLRYYELLKYTNIKKPNMKIYLQYHIFPTQKDDLFSLINNQKTDADYDARSGAWYSGIYDDINIKEDLNNKIYRHFVMGNSKDGIANKEEVDSLKKMIKLCKKKNANIILVTVPYTEEYNRKLEAKYPDYLPNFYSLVGQIANDYDVSYYDYSHDERFMYNHKYFFNCDHMNRMGAIAFTDILLKDAGLIDL